MVRRIWLSTVVLFLAAPLIVVAGVSLNAKKRLLFPPSGWSLTWYSDLLSRKEWLLPIANSLGLALIAALLAVSVALPLAYCLWRRRVLLSRALYVLGLAPFMLPPVITALGFLSFWVTLGFYGELWTVMISHAIFFVTLPLVTITLGFQSIDQTIVEAARTLGADERQIARTIALPLVRPYLLSGYAFVFVLSMNEYIITYMVAGFTVETLPIKIFNSLRYGYTPVMACAAVAFVALAVLVFGLTARFGDLPRLLGAWQADKSS